MWVDAENEFSDGQDASSFGTGDNASTNVLDLGAIDAGDGEPVYLVFQVDETVAASGGAASMQLELETDDAAAMGSATQIALSEEIAKATLVAGYQRVFALPHDLERFVRLNYRVVTNALTDGEFSAFLTKNPQNYKSHADAL